MLAHLPWSKPSAVLSALMPPEWTENAACKDLEPQEADAYFFPERGHSADKARAFCSSCPVARQCLEWGLSSGVEFGIFGGTSPRQRQALVKERNGGAPRRKPTLCSMGCGARAVARELCQRHYDRERYRATASA